MLSWLFCAFAVNADTVDREKLIKVTTEREGDTTHFFVENLQNADVTVTFEMSLENLEATAPLPHTATYSGKRIHKAFSVSPKDKDKTWNWSYTYYATLGSLQAIHDDSYVYSLPYAAGKSYRVSQGYNGDYSHFGANQFAIDWKMPTGTSVHAAREGIVVGIKADSGVGGPDSKYDCDANYILIQHPDGTLGQYVHLAKGGNKVKVGDYVRAGDWIGLSGNTGHTTGPHLHFSVFKARDGKQRQSIPIKYRTAEAVAAVLEKGKSYQAPLRKSGQLAADEPRGTDILGVALPSP